VVHRNTEALRIVHSLVTTQEPTISFLYGSVLYTTITSSAHYLLALSTLPPVPVAEGAGTSLFAAAARLLAAEAVIPVALLTAFLITPAFLTIVVWALESEF
jgi:hypothetical protein